MSASTPTGQARRFTNDAKGHRALIAWLQLTVSSAWSSSQPALTIAPWSAALPRPACRCQDQSPPCPALRRSLGRLAKTELLDAALLARFGALLEPPARPVLSPTLDAMRELQVARRALIKDRTAALNRQKTALASAQRQLPSGSGRSPPARRHRGPLSSLRTRIRLSRPACHPQEHSWHRASHCLEPARRDARTRLPRTARRKPRRPGARWPAIPVGSGKRIHPRRPRRPASGALHAGPGGGPLQPRSQSQVPGPAPAGKPPKVALTAIMRKLLILANALLRDRRTWTPKPA